MRAKTAPTLRAHLSETGTSARCAAGGDFDAARAELRALLACARTLDALHSAMEEPPSAVVACWRDSAGRALARLGRASRASGRGTK